MFKIQSIGQGKTITQLTPIFWTSKFLIKQLIASCIHTRATNGHKIRHQIQVRNHGTTWVQFWTHTMVANTTIMI